MTGIFLLILAVALTGPLTGQDVLIRGRVIRMPEGRLLAGVRVESARTGSSTMTDMFGLFSLWLTALPDTLMVSAPGLIGSPTVIRTPPRMSLTITMNSDGATLPAIMINAAETGRDFAITGSSEWHLSRAVIDAAPRAIEPDIMRSLIQVPAVRFTTPLSARPLIRGYESEFTSVRIDGVELINPYHLGRILSSFPVDGTEQVSVRTAPFAAGDGDALAGIIDIEGREGRAHDTEGGGMLSLISASAWAGGGSPNLAVFGAGRAAHISNMPIGIFDRVPYNLSDIYLNANVPRESFPLKVSLYRSRDRIVNTDDTVGMEWGNTVVSARSLLANSGGLTARVQLGYGSFSEDIQDGFARKTHFDARNRFSNASASFDVSIVGAASRFTFGIQPGWRSVDNRIVPLSGARGIDSVDLRSRYPTLGLYGAWTRMIGPGSLNAGIRLDAGNGNLIWQPRLTLRAGLSRHITASAGYGRTGRLYHVVGDPRPEPELLFYDFWLNAGSDGIPVPIVDHFFLGLKSTGERAMGRVSLFASTARGLVELRPLSSATGSSSQFRTGRGRTAGLELEGELAADRNGDLALDVSYILSVSQRRWSTIWVHWSQDRRHQLRVILKANLGRKWSLTTIAEAASGAPVTPIKNILYIGTIDPRIGLRRHPSAFRAGRIPGTENSAIGPGVFHVDFGARYHFEGPGHGNWQLGISVINLNFGPVAPSEPMLQGTTIVYEREFILPPIPTFTLRAEF